MQRSALTECQSSYVQNSVALQALKSRNGGYFYDARELIYTSQTFLEFSKTFST